MSSWNRGSDNDFFDDLFGKYYGRILNYCRTMIRQENVKMLDTAEDLAQDTFLTAREKLEELKTHPKIIGWLYSTAHNKIKDSARKTRRKNRHEIIFEDFWSELAKNNRTVKIHLDEMDLDKITDSVLNDLSKEDYELFNDYFLMEMPTTELAKKYTISLTTLSTRIYRMKQRFKKIAHEYFENQPF